MEHASWRRGHLPRRVGVEADHRPPNGVRGRTEILLVHGPVVVDQKRLHAGFHRRAPAMRPTRSRPRGGRRAGSCARHPLLTHLVLRGFRNGSRSSHRAGPGCRAAAPRDSGRHPLPSASTTHESPCIFGDAVAVAIPRGAFTLCVGEGRKSTVRSGWPCPGAGRFGRGRRGLSDCRRTRRYRRAPRQEPPNV